MSSVHFFRQDYWSGLPFPSPVDLPDPGIKPISPVSPVLQADSLPLSHQRSPFTCVGGGLVVKLCLTLATPWIVACQAPLFMGVSRHEHWNELPCPPPGDLPNPGIKPSPPALQADSLPSEPLGITVHITDREHFQNPRRFPHFPS